VIVKGEKEVSHRLFITLVRREIGDRGAVEKVYHVGL
jgi:hypothetical protein